jgi:transcriptional regulator with XRE-family HTH domain
MHVMNEPQQDTRANVPTPEQIVGHQVRLLRQARGWSQQEVAKKMRAYGYKWSQATVTRLESATRPIRVNELADLAMLFDVPVTQFLDLRAWEVNDLDALTRELSELSAMRDYLTSERDKETALMQGAAQVAAALTADLARIDGRVEVLTEWASRLGETAQDAPREGDRRE